MTSQVMGRIFRSSDHSISKRALVRRCRNRVGENMSHRNELAGVVDSSFLLDLLHNQRLGIGGEDLRRAAKIVHSSGR